MSRRVNPRPTQMFFYCNPMATKRSDKNQINIRLDDEQMALLDAHRTYMEAQLKFKLNKDELEYFEGMTRPHVAKKVLVKALKDLNISYEQQTTEDEEVSPYDGSH